MTDYIQLESWELEKECRKIGHDARGSKEDLRAFLKEDDQRLGSIARPTRIQMELDNDVDYARSYTYEIIDECLVRGFPRPYSKYDGIRILLNDDAERIANRRECFTNKNDRDGLKLALFEVDFTSFRTRQNLVSHTSRMEDIEIFERIKMYNKGVEIVEEGHWRLSRVEYQLAKNSAEQPEEAEPMRAQPEKSEPEEPRLRSTSPATANAVADKLTPFISSPDTGDEANELMKPKNHLEVTQCEKVRFTLRLFPNEVLNH
jgi:exonuclease VII small subunit